MATAGEKLCRGYFYMLELKLCVIDKAIDQYQPWLRAYVRAKGQLFQQLLE